MRGQSKLFIRFTLKPGKGVEKKREAKRETGEFMYKETENRDYYGIHRSTT